MATETDEERAAREAEEERRREIEAEIFRLEGEIAIAEENLRQLEALKTCCNDYQLEFEAARTARKAKLAEFYAVWGQKRLVDAYGEVLEKLLNGTEYVRAYDSMNSAKSKVNREMEIQRQMIDERNARIAGLRIEL